jgi:hypothetical protein
MKNRRPLPSSDIVQAHGILTQELVSVVEGRLEHHVAAQRRGGEHLAGRRGVDGLLPRVRGARYYKPELEEPLCKKAQMEMSAQFTSGEAEK